MSGGSMQLGDLLQSIYTLTALAPDYFHYLIRILNDLRYNHAVALIVDISVSRVQAWGVVLVNGR